MTDEELKKEQEIQKMAETAATYCYNKFDEEICVEEKDDYDCRMCAYCSLIEAGYRKADEVRKETAKEILDEEERILNLQFWTSEGGYTDTIHNCAIEMVLGIVKGLKKEYGVEVEE